jgi:hypothetical protein
MWDLAQRKKCDLGSLNDHNYLFLMHGNNNQTLKERRNDANKSEKNNSKGNSLVSKSRQKKAERRGSRMK